MADNVYGELEHTVKTLTIDDTLPAEVEALKAAGWELIPGILPVAIYHVVRRIVKPVDATDMQMRMEIDESRVAILRNGKLVEE